MIVISAGLPKSGTGLYFNLTNDLLVQSGGQDVRVIRDRYLANVLKYYNCNLDNFNYSNFLKVFATQLKAGSFVVKTHEPPIQLLNLFSSLNLVKCTCIYRDPRDVVLSAIDHGEKIRTKGEAHTVARCETIESTIPIVKGWMDRSIMKWLGVHNVLTVKYENLTSDPLSELKRLADFLNIDVSAIDLKELYSKYDKNSLDSSKMDYLHFNQGVINRFRSVLSTKELESCNDHFSEYLKTLGYQP